MVRTEGDQNNPRRQELSTSPSTYLLTYLLTYLPTYLPACRHLSTRLPLSYQPTIPFYKPFVISCIRQGIPFVLGACGLFIYFFLWLKPTRISFLIIIMVIPLYQI